MDMDPASLNASVWSPKNLQKHHLPPGILKGRRRLVLSKETVPSTDGMGLPSLVYSTISYIASNSEMRCVATERKRAMADRIFNFLRDCDHPNILNPHGVWDMTDDNNSVFILYPYVDATIGHIPSSSLFHVGTDQVGAVCLNGFADQGYKIFSDLISAVDYINRHYESQVMRLPLRLSLNRIFYQQGLGAEYHILIGDFCEINDESLLKLPFNPSVKELAESNWNGLGLCLEALFDGHNVDSELHHFAQVLKTKSVTIGLMQNFQLLTGKRCWSTVLAGISSQLTSTLSTQWR